MKPTHAGPHRRSSLYLITLLLTATACADSPLPTDGLSYTGPLLARAPQAGPDNRGYLVRLHNAQEGAQSRADALARQHGGRVTRVFGDPVQGFAIDGLTATAAAALSRNPMVKYVEKEESLSPNNTQYLTEQSQWGLDRVDQRPNTLDGQYTYTNNGFGMHLYVVDSGIEGGHSEFSGRISTGKCVYAAGCDPYVDGFGHGTAVASIAAGYTAGVAKYASIHSVRIDDAYPGGVSSGVVAAALEWVYYNRVKPAVLNMSYGDDGSNPGSFLVLDWLNALAADGVIIVLSAGNAGRDAYLYRHNRVNPGLVVAAAGWDFSNPHLYWRTNSNFGPTVDIYGPGVNLFAASIWGGFRHEFGGTSGAAPFVAGSALQMMEYFPWQTPTDLEALMKLHGTPNVIENNPAGTPNLFVARF